MNKVMDKIKNYSLSLLEHFTELVLVFITFRYIIDLLGISKLGILSIANAITSFASVGSSGFAGSAVKFVADEYSNYNLLKLKQKISTISILVFVSNLFLTALILLGFKFWGKLILSNDELSGFSELLIFTLISFNFTVFGRFCQSCLDGMLMIKERTLLSIFAKIINIFTILICIGKFGLISVPISIIIQYTCVIVVAYYLFFKKIGFQIKDINLVNKGSIKEIIDYGLSFQINSLFQLLTDPMTRMLIKLFGGTYYLAIFEVIYKIFIQFRMMIVVILNTNLPYLIFEKKISTVNSQKTFRLNLFCSTILLTLPVVLMNFIFYFLHINDKGKIYSSTTVLIYLSLLVNLLGTPIFFENLANAKIKNNTKSLIVFIFVNVLFGYSLGFFFKYNGVLIGWMLGHVLSTIVLIYIYLRERNLNIDYLFRRSDISFLLVFILFSLMYVHFESFLGYNYLKEVVGIIITISAVIIYSKSYIILKKDNLNI